VQLVDTFSRHLDAEVRIVEDLVDRVASLEECARLAPTRAARRSSNKKDEHVSPS